MALVEAAKKEIAGIAGDDPVPAVRRRRLVYLRDAAMVSLAYDAALRSEELVRAEVADLEPAPEGDGTLTIPRSKTDREGEGAEAHVSRTTMSLIAAWVEAAEIESGPLYRAVSSAGFVRPQALKPGAVTDSFRRLARLVVDETTKEGSATIRSLTSHSGRVGAAQDALVSGEDIAGICQAFRWQSPSMPIRYTRRLAARQGTGARLHAKAGR
jgi:integrase